MRGRMITFLLFGWWAIYLSTCEPLESQFSYESQLLEKMIRMELKMEQMEARINQTQNNVNAAIQNVILTLDNKTAEIELLEKRVDIPLVAFHATGPEDTSIDIAQKLILKTAVLNLGEGYDRFIGMFTAPVSGLYLFTTHICSHIGNAFTTCTTSFEKEPPLQEVQDTTTACIAVARASL